MRLAYLLRLQSCYLTGTACLATLGTYYKTPSSMSPNPIAFFMLALPSRPKDVSQVIGLTSLTIAVNP